MHTQLSAATSPAMEWPQMELTYAQVRVLGALAAGPRRMGDLVSTLHSQSSTMTAVVDRLVSKGLVKREDDPTDRRAVLCVLTPEGRFALDQLTRASQGQYEGIYSTLTDAELAVVEHATEIVLNALLKKAGALRSPVPALN
jgi:DNA-binding MarR family transcriptional regulator